MTTEIKELLAVLGLPEEEQRKLIWDWVYNEYPGWEVFEAPQSLADLAFRLRDKAGQGRFVDAIVEVFEFLFGYSDYKSVMMWLCSQECQPVHWIIAALIAKELAK